MIIVSMVKSYITKVCTSTLGNRYLKFINYVYLSHASNTMLICVLRDTIKSLLFITLVQDSPDL